MLFTLLFLAGSPSAEAASSWAQKVLEKSPNGVPLKASDSSYKEFNQILTEMKSVSSVGTVEAVTLTLKNETSLGAWLNHQQVKDYLNRYGSVETKGPPRPDGKSKLRRDAAALVDVASALTKAKAKKMMAGVEASKAIIEQKYGAQTNKSCVPSVEQQLRDELAEQRAAVDAMREELRKSNESRRKLKEEGQKRRGATTELRKKLRRDAREELKADKIRQREELDAASNEKLKQRTAESRKRLKAKHSKTKEEIAAAVAAEFEGKISKARDLKAAMAQRARDAERQAAVDRPRAEAAEERARAAEEQVRVLQAENEELHLLSANALAVAREEQRLVAVSEHDRMCRCCQTPPQPLGHTATPHLTPHSPAAGVCARAGRTAGGAA